MMMIITEIKHESHKHNLRRENSREPFPCDGCKELGSGLRYRCEKCNYNLHKDCALAPPSMSHPFFGESRFEILEKGEPERFCDACGKDVLGFVYHCREEGHDLHPCCANLPDVLEGEGLKLRLRKSLSSKCGICEHKNLWENVKGWSYEYKSSDGKWQFHVSCVKAMLVENRVAKKKCSDLDTKMRTLSSYDGSKVSTISQKKKVSTNLQLKSENGKVVSNSSSNKGKTSKWWKMAKTLLVLIITVIIGDPTALLASVLVNFIS